MRKVREFYAESTRDGDHCSPFARARAKGCLPGAGVSRGLGRLARSTFRDAGQCLRHLRHAGQSWAHAGDKAC